MLDASRHHYLWSVGLPVPNARSGINLLRLTCVVAVTTTWVAFILSSLVIASTVAWSDGCHFLDLAATSGFEAVGLDGLSAGVRRESVCCVPGKVTPSCFFLGVFSGSQKSRKGGP